LKKKVKKIKPVLLLGVFLLFSALSLVLQLQQTELFPDNGDTVCFNSAELNSAGIVSFFNEEEWYEYETDLIVSARQLLFFDPNLFTLKCVARKSNSNCLHFIFELQSDLPPPGFA
jgi:hypothetical protein